MRYSYRFLPHRLTVVYFPGIECITGRREGIKEREGRLWLNILGNLNSNQIILRSKWLILLTFFLFRQVQVITD
jgi:hypothetical protein